jgi:hypothetical protein
VPDPGNQVGAWQAALVFNSALFNFSRYDFTARTDIGAKISQWFKNAGTWKTMPKFDRGSFNATHNYVLPGESWLPPDYGEPENPKPGEGSYGSLVWIELELISLPEPGRIEYIEYMATGVRRCKLLDENNIDIAGTFSFYPAQITFGAPPPQQYQLTITSTAGGTTNPAPGTYMHSAGSSVLVTALPDSGYVFSHWEKDGINIGSTNPYSILMDAPHTLHAVFTEIIPPPPPGGAIVYVDPPEIIDPTMIPSTTFWINITINNVTNMKICIFNLTYDPNIIGWISANIFKVQGAFPTPKMIIDDEAGFIWMKLTYPSAITATQPTPLVAIEFHVEAMGATVLDLHDTQLLDPQNNLIEHQAKDGFFATLIQDLTVTNVTVSHNWVYEGWEVKINVTVKNNGNQIETFWVAAYYNTSIIGNYTVVDLAPNDEITVKFTWNTTGVTACRNYTIIGKVQILPYEINSADNEYPDGYVKIRFMGDVNADGVVDIADIYLAALSFGATPTHPQWNPSADLNQDNVIDITDMYLIALNFGLRCQP